MKKKVFFNGLIDGMPICIGYLSVAFAFGVFSVSKGLSLLQTLMLSMTNVTSAGQLSAVPIIVAAGTFVELALTQFIINLRYSLMSVSLSQKFDKSIRFLDRFAIAFVMTDEVFAVASSRNGKVSRYYMYGLILMPYLGWSFGTLIGSLAGDIFPAMIMSALGIAIYGMFIAIVIPAAKKNLMTLSCVWVAVLFSCLFYYLPFLNDVPKGFVIIICAVLASLIFAAIDCLKKRKESTNEQ